MRHKARKDIKAEMNRRELIPMLFRIPDALDYICMVNDTEFEGKYEYTGKDWVIDTLYTYPEYFAKLL